MTTYALNPFREMERLLDELGRFGGEAWSTVPAVDVHADDDAVQVITELPGVAPGDVTLNVEDDVLSITATRAAPTTENAIWHRRERQHGTLTRHVHLPYGVEADRAEAKLADGVLTVRLPRAAADRPRRIAVQAA